MSMLTGIIIGFVLVYGALMAYLYFFQSSLLYHPAKNLLEPHHYGLTKAKRVILHTADEVNITSWYIPAKKGEPTLVYLHGNAGNVGDRSERFAIFAKTGMGMLIVSYRGFGDSEGEPSLEGLYYDARSAINYLIEEKNVPLKDIVLYGESLGSGIASKMALEYKDVRALILEAPYTSIADRAAELYPYVPVRLLLKDNFSNWNNLPHVHVPVMVFHGYLDETMPIEHSRRLLTIINEPKAVRFYEQVGHTNFDFQKVSEEVYRFVH